MDHFYNVFDEIAAIIANKPDLHVVEIIKPGQAKYTEPCTCAYCEHKDTNPTVPSAPQSSSQSASSSITHHDTRGSRNNSSTSTDISIEGEGRRQQSASAQQCWNPWLMRWRGVCWLLMHYYSWLQW